MLEAKHENAFRRDNPEAAILNINFFQRSHEANMGTEALVSALDSSRGPASGPCGTRVRIVLSPSRWNEFDRSPNGERSLRQVLHPKVRRQRRIDVQTILATET